MSSRPPEARTRFTLRRPPSRCGRITSRRIPSIGISRPTRRSIRFQERPTPRKRASLRYRRPATSATCTRRRSIVSTRTPRSRPSSHAPGEWAHLGALGPLVRGQVGDTIRIFFRNRTDRPYSVHPHGVFYQKDSEGAPYADDDGVTNGDAVPANGEHTYTWAVPERAGPGPADGSSILWMYHSHVDEPKDANSGLIGPMIITRAGRGGPDGVPKDVDREFINMFMI